MEVRLERFFIIVQALDHRIGEGFSQQKRRVPSGYIIATHSSKQEALNACPSVTMSETASLISSAAERAKFLTESGSASASDEVKAV